MDETFTVIIPARFASERLPGKPLRDIAGKPLVQRTFESAGRCGASNIVVATDNEGIAKVVRRFGGEACMTSASHPSGTDRTAEAARILNLETNEIVVNVQGDEPDMPGELIDQVASLLSSDSAVKVATACCPLDNPQQYTDPSVVKLVVDAQGHAIYFSRAPIPHAREVGNQAQDRVPWRNVHRHIGIYAYRCGYLQTLAQTPPCELEITEGLEQLRVLWMGDKIAVGQACSVPGPGIDTVADLERAIRDFSGQQGI
ncbi:MAG TPA: 3-deoxy-manno-octulosonate cytidylyltransferase [Gammaproteobacteria bacterium]|nr:3-deoxy-manno-octulosonate cytidylyltransferase [Gammaproteobacteria bacterium]|tara:strand:+ start:34 stop:807 length:774 start_codon:yes stop_codon:yes gene_type:complete